MYPDELPISARRGELLDAIANHQVLVVAGETGSGKSTQLPKLCLEAGRGLAGMVGHTQPRRIAARSIAERVAEELGVPLGGPVGYKVRFTDRASDGTLVKVMTDGVLLAELHNDRQLQAYDTLIIDEAHERSLNIDFILGYLKRLLSSRADLKVIITSATIDTARFSAHFDGAPVIEVSGRAYPVNVRYRPWGEAALRPDDEEDAELAGEDGRFREGAVGAGGGADGADGGEEAQDEVQAVCDAVEELCQEGPGDILVFFPGEREIRDAAEALGKRALRGLEVMPLYGRLSSAEQHRVFEPHQGRRAVLATNVAETSLTVPGVRYVVDTGTARVSRYSRRTKVQRLPIEAISRASADQRAGRCGRLGPGVCIRLYSAEDYQARPQFTEPEILRTNLASVLLQMAAIGLGDIEEFPFVDPPDRRNVKDGIVLLEELGALAPGSGLTRVGRTLAQLPVDPRLGRMVLEASRLGCLGPVLVIVAGLSVQDPRERPADKREAAAQLHGRFADASSDFLSYLALWRYLEEKQSELSSGQFRRLCRRELISYQRAREWQDVHGQLADICRQVHLAAERPSGPVLDQAKQAVALHQALLSGVLSQVGLREGERTEFYGPRNARFAIWPGSVLAKKMPRWVMAAELVETSRLWARVVAPIRPQWLEKAAAHLLQWTYSAPEWDRRRASAVMVARATLYGLPVVVGRRVHMATFDAEEARHLFIHHALVEGDWEEAPGLVQRNRESVERVNARAQRARRPDVMVGSQALFDFYDARVPEKVTSGAGFTAWWGEERRRSPELLDAGPEDLMGRASLSVDLGAFPDTWAAGSAVLPLAYTWQPGSDDDGVRVEVPLAQLNQLAGEGLEWQVPGLRQELVLELLRSLPKDLRRQLVPMPEHARGFVEEAAPGDGPLLDVLARHMSEVASVVITARDFDWARVPAHLRPTFCVIGERGQVLATGKEIGALMEQLGPQMEAALQAAAAASELGPFQSQRFTAWEFGDLPRQFEPAWNGYRLCGYPALQDEGDGVSVRVFPSPAAQDAAMFAGTRRLLMLNLGQRQHLVGSIEALLDNNARLAVASLATRPSPPYRSTKQLAEDVLVAAVEAAMAQAGGPAWTAGGFGSLLSVVRDQVQPLARQAIKVVCRALVQAQDLRRHLDRLALSASGLPAGAPLRVALDDMEGQFRLLVGPRFVRLAGARRVADIERYLTALQRRLEKLPSAPARDMALTTRVQAVQAELGRARARGVPAPVLDEARWLVEELRVSLFAQALGTKAPVSEERILRLVLNG